MVIKKQVQKCRYTRKKVIKMSPVMSCMKELVKIIIENITHQKIELTNFLTKSTFVLQLILLFIT